MRQGTRSLSTFDQNHEASENIYGQRWQDLSLQQSKVANADQVKTFSTASRQIPIDSSFKIIMHTKPHH